MFKGTNKRGWIRIVEAFFAILVIAVVVLIVVQQDQNKRVDVSVRVHGTVASIIRDIQLDNNVRSEIINVPNSGLPVNWDQFNISAPLTMDKIINETPNYLDCVGQICATNSSCLLEQSPITTVYSDSAIISSDIQTYNPKLIKLFCWQTGENVSSNAVVVFGNGIVEAGETCDDGNTVSGDGCSSTGQIESGWSCQGQPSICTQGVPSPPGGAIYVSSCREITSPGNYLITSNLSGTAPNPCIYIHDTSNVQVDCQGHNVTVPGLITGQTIVEINNTNSFSLTNCLLPVMNITSSAVLPLSLHIERSSQGVISGNTFYGNSSVNGAYLSNVDIINNVFNRSLYQQAYFSNNTIIENNFFDWNYSGRGPSLIVSNNGFGTIIRNNFIEGRSKGNIFSPSGWDNGITFDSENGDLITGNVLQNFLNCGIENLGLTQNSIISNNTIKNATFCGIGGWYWNSLKSNTFFQNKMDNTGTMFTFNRRYALKTGESFVYFTDNNFTGNVLTNFNISLRGYTTDITMDRNDWGEVTSDKFIASNDTFTNNDFTHAKGPYITPISAVVDGGSNICGPPALGQPTNPLNCS